MKFIITKEEIDLIPPVVRRRMTERDFDILDAVIHNNKRYYVAQDFNRYLEGNLRDSLNEFIHDYKLEEINQDLDYDDLDDEENIKYKIFWQLIPFLEKKYHDLLYDYHMEYHGRRGNVNESSINRTKQMILNSFDEIDYIKTIKKFNLTPKVLDRIFPQGISEIGVFGDYGKCSIIYDLIKAFFISGFLKGKTLFEYNNKSYEFIFYNDNHTRALMIDIIDLDYKDAIAVYATPFYEGYCGLPISVDVYIQDEVLGGTELEEYIDYYIDLNEKNFKTFSDITNWFNNDYPKIILKKINPLWDKFRNGEF
jgi:hypothetical protein